MIDHVAIQCDDVARALDFYVDVLEPLEVREVMRYETPAGHVVGLGGADGFPHFWLGPTEDAGRRPIHLAFTAPTRAAVDEVHRRVEARAGETLHVPRVWPEYHAAYYGVFFRDPDGHNVEAVCHHPE